MEGLWRWAWLQLLRCAVLICYAQFRKEAGEAKGRESGKAGEREGGSRVGKTESRKDEEMKY